MYLHAFLSTCSRCVYPTSPKESKSTHLWLEAMTVLFETSEIINRSELRKKTLPERHFFQSDQKGLNGCELNVHLKDTSWLAFIAKNNFLWQHRVESLFFFLLHTGVISLMLLWPSSVKTSQKRVQFEFPETCCVKINVLLETTWCVIAHNERSVGCKSLCPLLPIIPFLCGSIIFASFDKGTRNNNSLHSDSVCVCIWLMARRHTRTSVHCWRSVWHQD